MLYYKIIDSDNKLIGAETNVSLRYVKYQLINDIVILTDKSDANGITVNGEIYHLNGLPDFIVGEYETVSLVPINKAEYEAITEAIEQQLEETGTVEYDNITTITEEVDTSSIEFFRQAKIKEMSNKCNKTITEGVDVTLSDGLVHHFDLTLEDQINLLDIAVLQDNAEMIPYHASGETYHFYSAADMNEIIAAASYRKKYQTAYFNSLKQYINSLEDIATIVAIEYGDEIPSEFITDVLSSLM